MLPSFTHSSAPAAAAAAAEDIGVIADPEMTAIPLGPQHRFAILATDGIWEFISSQRAVDMVGVWVGGGGGGHPCLAFGGRALRHGGAPAATAVSGSWPSSPILIALCSHPLPAASGCQA